MTKTAEAEATASKRRKTKELPEGLSNITAANLWTKVKARLETDEKEPGEIMVVHEIMLEGGDTMLDLSRLTSDQLRRLCKSVGVQYVNNCSKFQCRKALWVVAQQGRDGLTITDRTSNNIIRMSNIIFSHKFLDSFLALNDIKTQAGNVRGMFSKGFWGDVAEAMNASEYDIIDANILQIILSEEDEHYEDMKALDLKDFDIMTPTAIKNKVMRLLKARKVIMDKMTDSGELDGNPYNFVRDAMSIVGKSGLSVLGCYYFYKRCENHPEVDVHHHPDILNGGLMANADYPDSVVDLVSTEAPQNEKKRAYAAMAEISGVVKEIAVGMREMNRLAQESTNALKEKNRLTKQSQLIEVAKHLGKHEVLQGLLASLSSSSGN